MKKPFKELDLSNAFLFAAALEDEETCQQVLEIILGFPVSKVKVRAEHTLLFSSDFRSIRLDIYASDEMQVMYNIEMQNSDEKNIAKRSRYHQAEMDVMSLKPGEDFNDLKPSYVVFICTFDPFGYGLYRYTFEQKCLERNLKLNDGTTKIFLNTKGKNADEVPKALIHFLKYVEQSTDEYVASIEDEAVEKIHNKVKQLKEWRELEASYMYFEELLEERQKEGKAEGRAEGRAEGKAEAKQEALLLILSQKGKVSPKLTQCIQKQRKLEILDSWMKLALQAESIQSFEAQVEKTFVSI